MEIRGTEASTSLKDREAGPCHVLEPIKKLSFFRIGRQELNEYFCFKKGK